MTARTSTDPSAINRLAKAVVQVRVRLQPGDPASDKLLARRGLSRLELTAYAERARREPRIAARTFTSLFAGNRLAIAAVRGQIRLQPSSTLPDKLPTFRLLQAHPQQLRMDRGESAWKGGSAWTH